MVKLRIPSRSEPHRPGFEYIITLPAGLLAGCLFDLCYQVGLNPILLGRLLILSFSGPYEKGQKHLGKLIYHLYIIFIGPYRDFWQFHVVIVLIPLVFVNFVGFLLYRKSRFQEERVFFIVLGSALNGLAIFTSVNILRILFIV